MYFPFDKWEAVSGEAVTLKLRKFALLLAEID